MCLAGNHDLAVTGEIPLDEFSKGASLAAQWTREVIAPENLAFLEGLSPQGEEERVGLYHASPRDPVWEYVLSALLAELCLDVQRQRVCLIGHSHVALSFVRHDGELATGEPQRDRTQLDVADGEWLLNPGSVGQPRDGDPRASWLLLDLDEMARVLPPRRLRHRRRRRSDPRGAPAGLAGRAPGVRAVRSRSDLATACARPRLARPSAWPRDCSAWRPRCSSSCGSSNGKLIPVADSGPLQERLRNSRAGGRKRQRRLHGHRNSARQDRTGLQRAARDRRRGAARHAAPRHRRTCANARSRCARSRSRRTTATSTTSKQSTTTEHQPPTPRRRQRPPPRPQPPPCTPNDHADHAPRAPEAGPPPGRANRRRASAANRAAPAPAKPTAKSAEGAGAGGIGAGGQEGGK